MLYYYLFILGLVCLVKNGFLETIFKLSRVCLPLKKLVNENTFKSKKNLVLFSGKYFSFILGEKHFSEVVKKLEILYYLLIITNLFIKLLIAIYFILNFFSISPLRI